MTVGANLPRMVTRLLALLFVLTKSPNSAAPQNSAPSVRVLHGPDNHLLGVDLIILPVPCCVHLRSAHTNSSKTNLVGVGVVRLRYRIWNGALQKGLWHC